MDQVFAPGCALMMYKPRLAEKVEAFLAREFGAVARHERCCRHQPGLPAGTRLINVCPGCDRRFRKLYEGIGTVSLWELLVESADFPFPDYGGAAMAIQDACPTRDQAGVLDAVRTLLERMNIRVVEPRATRDRGTCCGDSAYGSVPVGKVKELMAKRAAEMPEENVVVYCVSCAKAMHNGGKRPRYLVDLLFGEETRPGGTDPDLWHADLDRYIGSH